MENQKIIEKIREINEEIDINEHEVQKFLLIFHSLFEIVTSEEAIEETDGFVNDTILTVVKIIADLLKNNIERFKLPAVLKTALKKLKSLFTKIKLEETVQTEETGIGGKMPRAQYRPRRPVVPAGRGQKNNDRIRVRTKWYKIKRFMLQPRYKEVKHNGRVVRRMVVRRRTIYPSTQRRREY